MPANSRLRKIKGISERYEQIRLNNEMFMKGALEERYIVPNNGEWIWVKEVKEKDPTKIQILRTCQFKEPELYLFVIDFDWKGFDRNLYKIAQKLARKFPNAIYKASGKKGFNFILPIEFEENTKENRERLMYLFYKKFNLQLYNVELTRKRNLTDKTKILMDLAMVDNRRLIRSFCIRENGNFSVPFNPLKDTWQVVCRRMKLQVSMPIIDEFEYICVSEKMLPELPKSLQEPKIEFKRIHVSGIPKYITELLKRSELDHEYRFAIVSFLYRFVGMKPEEIINLILSEAKWSDKDYNHVSYQVNHICKKDGGVGYYTPKWFLAELKKRGEI